LPAGVAERTVRVREILKTNNPVELNFAQAVLADAGIGCAVFDTNMSVLDGSMVILPQRLMVADSDAAAAAALLKDAFAAPSPLE
jgi:Putative prokaryotic signal transducing protein